MWAWSIPLAVAGQPFGRVYHVHKGPHFGGCVTGWVAIWTACYAGERHTDGRHTDLSKLNIQRVGSAEGSAERRGPAPAPNDHRTLTAHHDARSAPLRGLGLLARALPLTAALLSPASSVGGLGLRVHFCLKAKITTWNLYQQRT